MTTSGNAMKNTPDQINETDTLRLSQENALTRIGIITFIFNVAFLINLIIEAVKKPYPFSYQNIAIFTAFFVATMICGIVVSKKWVKNLTT